MSCSAPSCRACSSDISPCSADCEALPGAGAAAAGGIAACELLASCSTAAGAPASATGSANPGSAPRKHWDASSSDTPVCKQRACSGSRMMVTRAAQMCWDARARGASLTSPGRRTQPPPRLLLFSSRKPWKNICRRALDLRAPTATTVWSLEVPLTASWLASAWTRHKHSKQPDGTPYPGVREQVRDHLTYGVVDPLTSPARR